jgi:hypothetical protein
MAKQVFNEQGSKITDLDIKKIEKRIGKEIPKELASHYLNSNGGIPINCYWPQGDGIYLWIQQFLSMKESIGEGRTLEDTYLLGQERKFLPKSLLPFAVDYGGNYFCIDDNSHIYFYALDAWEQNLSYKQNHERISNYLCQSLSDFLTALIDEEEAEK